MKITILPVSDETGNVCTLGTTKDPVTYSEPVNLCVSSKESPNFVEPLSKIIDADTNSV